MCITCSGYRNKYDNFYDYHFCSTKCLDFFKKYNCCYRCNQDGEGTFIQDLNYTLCNKRFDHYPSCFDTYTLELRFINDYHNHDESYNRDEYDYELDIIDQKINNLSQNFINNDFHQLIINFINLILI